VLHTHSLSLCWGREPEAAPKAISATAESDVTIKSSLPALENARGGQERPKQPSYLWCLFEQYKRDVCQLKLPGRRCTVGTGCLHACECKCACVCACVYVSMVGDMSGELLYSAQTSDTAAIC
jgi:hypothetical protein